MQKIKELNILDICNDALLLRPAYDGSHWFETKTWYLIFQGATVYLKETSHHTTMSTVKLNRSSLKFEDCRDEERRFDFYDLVFRRI